MITPRRKPPNQSAPRASAESGHTCPTRARNLPPPAPHEVMRFCGAQDAPCFIADFQSRANVAPHGGGHPNPISVRHAARPAPARRGGSVHAHTRGASCAAPWRAITRGGCPALRAQASGPRRGQHDGRRRRARPRKSCRSLCAGLRNRTFVCDAVRGRDRARGRRPCGGREGQPRCGLGGAVPCARRCVVACGGP